MAAAVRTAMVVPSIVGTTVIAVVVELVGAVMTVAVPVHVPLVLSSAVRCHALFPLSIGLAAVVQPRHIPLSFHRLPRRHRPFRNSSRSL